MNTAGRKRAMDEPGAALVRASARRVSSGVRPMVWLALVLALPCGRLAWAQQSGSPNNSSQQTMRPLHTVQPDVDQNQFGDAGDPVFQERRLRQLNAAQHKSMVSDADKLVKLVTELNAEINSTTPNSLTPEQLRKVVEIEKLARSVRDKMRISVQGTTVFPDAAPQVPGLRN